MFVMPLHLPSPQRSYVYNDFALAPAALCHIKIRYAPEVREQNTQTLSLRNGL